MKKLLKEPKKTAVLPAPTGPLPPVRKFSSTGVETYTPDEALTFTKWLERKGKKLEAGQKALASVLFDHRDPIDLEGDDRARALRLFAAERMTPKALKSGIKMAICGGRSGKSLIAAWRLVHLAATVSLALEDGEQAYAIIVAPDLRLAEQTLRFCVGAAQAWFPEEGRVIEESTLGFTLVRNPDNPLSDRWTDDRVRFLILPASRGGAAQRGRVYVGALLEEAAFFRGEDSLINDKDILDAIKPRIAKGGEVLIMTTPWAKAGEVYALYERNFGHSVDAVVAHAPTWEMRTDENILYQVEREKENNIWNYHREFGAEFMNRDQGMFFDPDALEACCAPEPQIAL